MFNSNVPSLSDIAAVTGNRNDSNFGDGNGWWILIILFAIFGGWGNGWNGNNVDRTATSADIQRGFDTQSVISKLDGLSNGLCDGFYAMNTSMLNSVNTLQNSIQQQTISDMQNTNTITSQMADIRYNLATDTCAITTAINQASQNIMQNCNNNYRALHDEIVAIQMASKDEKIAEQASIINALNLSASQQAQNAYLVEQLKRCTNTGCCNTI
jgi:hypothetical protein